MEKKNLVKKQKSSTEITSPADMIKLAVSGGADLEKLEKLLLLQERFEANQAKKAYVEAITLFKANVPKIMKDKVNKQYGSKYVSLANLVNTISPVLSEYGLSASWNIEQNGTIKVTCIVLHTLGHSESASFSADADSSGSKNAIQQKKSTVTYCKAVTFESILGLASTDANFDDDGKSHEECITEEQAKIIQDGLKNLGADLDSFLSYIDAPSLETILAKDYNKAITAIKARKDKQQCK